MCQKEHIYHLPCRHWGRDRLTPCIRSNVVGGRHVGCLYVDIIGSENSNEKCYACKRRQVTHPFGWNPFRGVSAAGMAVIEEKARQRSHVLAARGEYDVYAGKPYPSPEKAYSIGTDDPNRKPGQRSDTSCIDVDVDVDMLDIESSMFSEQDVTEGGRSDARRVSLVEVSGEGSWMFSEDVTEGDRSNKRKFSLVEEESDPSDPSDDGVHKRRKAAK